MHRITCFVGVNRLFDLTYCLIFLSPFYRSKVNTFLPSFILLSRCFFLSACFDVHSLCFVGVNRLFDLTYCLIFLSPFYRSKVNTFLPSFKLLLFSFASCIKVTADSEFACCLTGRQSWWFLAPLRTHSFKHSGRRSTPGRRASY
jgi:hypothetical protein